jgi:hypothetical protein
MRAHVIRSGLNHAGGNARAGRFFPAGFMRRVVKERLDITAAFPRYFLKQDRILSLSFIVPDDPMD